MNGSNGNEVAVEDLRRQGEAVHSEHGLLVRSPRTGVGLLITALTDLDGTVNDEHEPEFRRLDTIGPAREAFGVLAACGVGVGICTARSTGEALRYRTALNVSGPIIAENGAVVLLTDGTRRLMGDPGPLRAAVDRIQRRVGRRFPHSLDWAGLEEAWERERRGESAVFLGHPDREALRLAADRYASCFLVGLDPAEKRLAAGVACEMGLSCFGELLHLIPSGVGKGAALDLLNGLLVRLPVATPWRPDTVVPIVFGNGENDLPLFAKAIQGGGAAVLVGDARSATGFHLDTRAHPVPEGTIKIPRISHGYAIRKSLPLLADFLATRHGIRFPW